MESHYITLYRPLLNGTQVPAKKIIPSETVLQQTLIKIAPYCIVFGIAPASDRHQLPTVSIRYFTAFSSRIVSNFRRSFKASNKKPSGLQWAEFVRRKYGSWWRTRCNGMAIELAPWAVIGEDSKGLAEEATVQTLAGVELMALQPYQLSALMEQYSYIEECYPGIAALESDPIPLIWTPPPREPQATTQEVLPASASTTPIANLDMSDSPTINSSPDEQPSSSSNMRAMDRTFLDIEGVEVEVCKDVNTCKLFVRHHLVWKIARGTIHVDLDPRCVDNLRNLVNKRLTTIRWIGYSYRVERVYFIEDEMEVDTVLMPLAMFEDLIRGEYRNRGENSLLQEDDCIKLGRWLEDRTISKLLVGTT
jgi:hypothetical protein